MPVTDDNTLLAFTLPPICRKKVTAAFDGGSISSDGGILLLAGADKRVGNGTLYANTATVRPVVSRALAARWSRRPRAL